MGKVSVTEEIEITPQMIEAGVVALTSGEWFVGPAEVAEVVLKQIILAMLSAREPPPS